MVLSGVCREILRGLAAKFCGVVVPVITVNVSIQTYESYT